MGDLRVLMHLPSTVDFVSVVDDNCIKRCTESGYIASKFVLLATCVKRD